ncbi:MAG: hypothetical protein ACRENP_21055 [Longimicrobiales bacterium]
MAYTLSTGARDDAVDRHSVQLYDSAILEIRTGAPPGPNAAATGTLLASITLPASAHGAPSSGSVALAGTWQDTAADGTGTAGHFRMRQSGDGNGADATQRRVEGTITATGGGGDLTLDNVSIAAAQQVTISSWTLTQPAS